MRALRDRLRMCGVRLVAGAVGRVAVAAAAGLAVSAFAGQIPPVAAEAATWEYLDVDLAAAVTESSGVARLKVTSGCTNEIDVQYEVGVDRAAVDGAHQTDTYDVSGSPAQPGADFLPRSGTFLLSRSRPFVIEIPIVQDTLAEGTEHVIVRFTMPEILAAFVGDHQHCETTGPDLAHSRAAFTIADDDAGAAAIGSATDRGGTKAGTATTTRSSGSAANGGRTAAAPPEKPPSAADPAETALPEADGVVLVGASAARPERSAGRGRVAAVVGGLGVTGAAGALVLAQRWSGRRLHRRRA